MAVEKKSISSAYTWWVVGPILGVIGSHRFYLRCYLSATLMTVLFLAGFFGLVWNLVVRYYSILYQFDDYFGAISADGIDYSSIPDPTQAAQISDDALQYSIIVIGLSGIWWLIDLFLIPSLVKRFNQERD